MKRDPILVTWRILAVSSIPLALLGMSSVEWLSSAAVSLLLAMLFALIVMVVIGMGQNA